MLLFRKYFGDDKEDEALVDIPLPDGVLENNIRMPLVVCVNKCDLQSSVLREDSSNKIQFILYHLRKFCVRCKDMKIQMVELLFILQ